MLEEMKERGILALAVSGGIRMVTHKDVGDEDVDRAIAAFKEILELIVREIEAKSILNPSKIYDYCVNPYTGCQVGCVYCYAALFMRRYSGHSEPWGEFVDAKINAPALLAKQIVKAKQGTIWFASVCDPYQPLEERYALTRRSLEVLVGRDFPVVIQTKSARVRRDLDVIRRIPDVEVGFSIASGGRDDHPDVRADLVPGRGEDRGPAGIQGRGHPDLRLRRSAPARGIRSGWPRFSPGPSTASSSTG